MERVWNKSDTEIKWFECVSRFQMFDHLSKLLSKFSVNNSEDETVRSEISQFKLQNMCKMLSFPQLMYTYNYMRFKWILNMAL